MIKYINIFYVIGRFTISTAKPANITQKNKRNYDAAMLRSCLKKINEHVGVVMLC